MKKYVHFWNVRQEEQNVVTVDAIIYSKKNSSYLAYRLLTFELKEAENEDAPFSHHHQRTAIQLYSLNDALTDLYIYDSNKKQNTAKSPTKYPTKRMVLISSL